jgi:hypothetical protein
VHYNCEDDKVPNEEQDRNEGIKLGMLSTNPKETIGTPMFMKEK